AGDQSEDRNHRRHRDRSLRQRAEGRHEGHRRLAVSFDADRNEHAAGGLAVQRRTAAATRRRTGRLLMDEIVIQTEAITKTYVSGTNEVHAVRGIDLTVRKGEFVAIMGTSGSGKSTLMNLLGCLDTATTGSYTLDGVQIAGLDKNALAAIRNQKIGFVFQGFNLLPRTTAIENVELPMLYDRSGKKRGNTRDLAAKA